MKKIIKGCLLSIVISTYCFAQSNNPISTYEGTLIQSLHFTYENQPVDTTLYSAYTKVIEETFDVSPQTQFNSFLTSYSISKLNLLPFIEKASPLIISSSQNAVELTIQIKFAAVTDQEAKKENIAKDKNLFPVIYNTEKDFVTLKAAASEMVYSNDNAWFSQPSQLTNGNPLAEKPTGDGYTGWLEGFASAGIYGISKVIPKANIHLYGGVNYLVSFSTGNELFTDKSRIYGAIEEAFVGFVGGGHTKNDKTYKYNIIFGRKQFTLGDGWIIVNTAMNGYDRAALQLNPRWAGKQIFTADLAYDKILLQGFSLKPNELDILDSKTTIRGINLQLKNNNNGILGLSYLKVPESNFSYYLPNGATYKREGLQVYNARFFKSTGNGGGLFYKAEVGYQRNSNFDMKAWAYYGELGWSFNNSKGAPTIGYRYAYFSGDDANTTSYNRWDQLYTGGNGEQWVQGSNMYKIVQNSNEITHRLQIVYKPIKKTQLVGQFWLFYAAEKNNIGGNPALSTLQSDFYGTEYNLTFKYFHSSSWYFHLNTAYTLPGSAIKDNVSNTNNWYCLSFFARYSF
jgi:hypothetical protein